ncbi:hypothetical protein ACE6H2_021722 [Prunus campanulata]
MCELGFQLPLMELQRPKSANSNSLSKKFLSDGSILLQKCDYLLKNSDMGTRNDYVLVEKRCLQNYKFSHGDVVVFSNYKERHIKRITALPGEWIGTRHSYDVLKIPEGHCWVEGDNSSSSLDSRSFGPIPLGLVQGRVTRIAWPPQRIGAVEKRTPQDTISSP